MTDPPPSLHDLGEHTSSGGSLSANFANLSKICGRGDTVEALSHVLAQLRKPGTPSCDDTVASVKAGGVDIGQAKESLPQLQLQPQAQASPLSDDDFVRVKNAVRDRDEGRRPVVSLPGEETHAGAGAGAGAGVGASETASSQALVQGSGGPPLDSSGAPGDPSTTVKDGAKGSSSAGIDHRLFAPVLRAILSGEGDHVLRRSLLCHPLLKASKAASTSAASPKAGSGAPDSAGQAAPSPAGGNGGRRKGSKSSKGSKVKKRDWDREREQEEWNASGATGASTGAAVTTGLGPVGQGHGQATAGSSRADRHPLDASQEMSHLVERVVDDGSLQSILILAKTLLCAVDPATASLEDTPSRQSPTSQQGGGKLGRSRAQQGATSGEDTGKSIASASSTLGSARSIGLTVRTASLQRLVARGLSGWSEIMELLRREKYRERMIALQGRPSLTACNGKAEIRGRLEVKGETSGVVTAVHVKERRRWYFEVILIGPSKGTRVGWARCGGPFSRGACLEADGNGREDLAKLGYGSDSWGVCGYQEGKSFHRAGRIRAARLEAATAKTRHDDDEQKELKENKSDDDDNEEDAEAETQEQEQESCDRDRDQDQDQESERKGKEDQDSEASTGARDSHSDPNPQELKGVGGDAGGQGSPEAGSAVVDEQEEDTADSIFLALGGLFRDTPLAVDQEGEDGGQIIEQSTPTPPTPILLPPPPGPSGEATGKEAVPAPSTPPARIPAPPPPPPPPPPPLPSQPLRSLADIKLPKSPLSRSEGGSSRAWGAGAVIGCLADLVSGDPVEDGSSRRTVNMYFFVNGNPMNGNVSVPIFSAAVGSTVGSGGAADEIVGAIDHDVDGEEQEGDDSWALCPAYSCASASDGVSINLGETPFQYPPDGLIQTLGPSGGEGSGDVAGAPPGVTSATLASPSSGNSNTREKRSRYGGMSSSGAEKERGSHPVLARAAERAHEAAFSLAQEGRGSSPSIGAGGRGEGTGNASPEESGGGIVGDDRSPSRSSGETGGSGNSGEGGRGRTKGIPGGVFAVRDAAVSRCVRFDGGGWAVARRPNLTVQALDVFLLEALVRPCGSASSTSGEDARDRMVILSQAGPLGFCFFIEGTKVVLELSGPDGSGDSGRAAEDASELARHCTPEGVLPPRGTWYKLSVAVSRDASQGSDQVIFYVDGLSVCKSKLPTCSGRGTPIVSQSPQRLRHVPGAIFIGGEQSKEQEKEAGGSSPEGREMEVGGHGVKDSIDKVNGLFEGEIAQVRVWSSPCSEATIQRLIGRTGVFEADATLICLWKVDEGIGSVLRNSRPLQPPKAPRGSKTSASGSFLGSEGHVELKGRWAWVSCFDPDDFESRGNPSGAGAGSGSGVSTMGGGTVETTNAARGDANDEPAGRLVAESLHEGSSISTTDFAPSPLASSPTLAVPAGGVVDFARSIGWRSVSTAGDEEEEEAYASVTSSTGGEHGTTAQDNDNEGSYIKPQVLSTTLATATRHTGALAALASSAALSAPTKTEIPAKDALLGILGRLFQESSIYLEPCHGDPLFECRPSQRAGHPDANVQLQLVRREERALKAVVQSEVRTYLLLRSLLWQLAAIAEGLRPDVDEGYSSTATPTAASSKTQSATSKSSEAKPTVPPTAALGPRDLLVAGLCTLRLLRANIYHMRATGVSPGTVGLGSSSIGGGATCLTTGSRRDSKGSIGSINSSGSTGEQRNPFSVSLLLLLLDYAGGVLDIMPPLRSSREDEDEDEDDIRRSTSTTAELRRESGVLEDSEMDALRRAVRYEAAEIVGRGLDMFLPEVGDRVHLLAALLRQACGSYEDEDADDENDDDNDEETKDDEFQQESKAREGKDAGNTVDLASAASTSSKMANSLLQVEMDEEGCAALLSGVCRAVCADPDLLLSLVPEAMRPPLTVRDVTSYVTAKVRWAERAQAQALQTRLLREAASGGASSGSSAPSGPTAGGHGQSSSNASPRLSMSRQRGLPGSEVEGGEGSMGLWRTGPSVGLPRTGDVVMRGPDWAWGNQDGEVSGRGLVVGSATWGRAVRRGNETGSGRTGRAMTGGDAGLGAKEFDGGDADENRPLRNAIRVMWEKGSINVYRWGVLDFSSSSSKHVPTSPSSLVDDNASARKPCYDLKVLRAPVVVQEEPGRVEVGSSTRDGSAGESKGGSGGGQSHQGSSKTQPVPRGELKWTIEEVEEALLPAQTTAGRGKVDRASSDGGDGAPTTRAVLKFMKNHAPQDWREPRRITGAENALVKQHKPEAVARFYREFVEAFGKNFTPPPVRGAQDSSLIKPEDFVQQQKAWELSKLLDLLLRVTHRLAQNDSSTVLVGEVGVGRGSISEQRSPEEFSRQGQGPSGEAGQDGDGRGGLARMAWDNDDAGGERQGVGEHIGDGVSVYLPETLAATSLLLSRLQSVMTRPWDPNEASTSPQFSRTLPGTTPVENFGPTGVTAPAIISGPPQPSGLVAKAGSDASGAGAGGAGSRTPVTASAGTATSTPPGTDDDPLADTFVGSTRRTRKWDWVRCCHSPVNPALAAGIGSGSGADGLNAQPVIPPVAVDPAFCHRTLRPGKPGPEGCTLEQGPARGWGVALATHGFSRGSGIHRWRVRLDSVNRRGHVFLGVATRQVALGSYLGADRHGWGYLVSQDLYHAGSRLRSGYGSRMSAGMTVELTLNTDIGMLSVGNADTGEYFGPAMTNLYQDAGGAVGGGGGISLGGGGGGVGRDSRLEGRSSMSSLSAAAASAAAAAPGGTVADDAHGTLWPAFAMHQPGDSVTYLPRRSDDGYAMSRSQPVSTLSAGGGYRSLQSLLGGGFMNGVGVGGGFASLGSATGGGPVASAFAGQALPLGYPDPLLLEHASSALELAAEILRGAGWGEGRLPDEDTRVGVDIVCRVSTAFKHPLLSEGGLLLPLVASLSQWHLLDDPEEGLGSRLTEALKVVLREADCLKRALGQEVLTDETKRCLVRLNRLQVVLACLAGKLLGALISGGIGSIDCGEAPNDLRSAVEEEVRLKSAGAGAGAASGAAGVMGRQPSPAGTRGTSGSSSGSSASGGPGGHNIGSGSGGHAVSSTTEREWLESPLLANGLVVSPLGAFAVGSGVSSAASSGASGIIGVGMVDEGTGGIGPVGTGPIEVFLRELVDGTPESPALALSQWVSKHVGENSVLARTGGPLVAKGVRGAAAAMLWHLGYAAAAQRMAGALAGAPAAARARVDSQVPPFFLLETWRKAVGLKSWAKSRRDRGTSYEATAACLTRHCRFLLSLNPATTDRPVGWLVQEFKAFTAAATNAVNAPTLVAPTPVVDPPASLPSAPPMPRRRSPSPTNRGLPSSRSFPGGTPTTGGVGGSGGSGRRWSAFSAAPEAGSGSLLRALETRHAERLSLVMGFLKGGIDLCRLRAAQLAADERARRRAVGLTTLRSLLAATGREGSSGVKAALLLYVPPALRGVLHVLAALGPDPIALQMTREAAARASRPGGATGMGLLMGQYLDSRTLPGGHYLAGLAGCPRSTAHEVRGAFEKLYSFLAGELETAAQQGDAPLQFALMDAWGVEVHEDDHDLLARVRIFNILQDILDATIKHSPGMSATTPMVSSAVHVARTSGVVAIGASSMSQALLAQDRGGGDQTAIADRRRIEATNSHGDEVVVIAVEGDRNGDEHSDATATAAEAAAAEAAATETAIAAAAEEVASAESHSLTQGAMKLVYLLAIQVATSGDASSRSSGGGSGISVSELATPLSTRAPQLVRARSGPATLSHAVFEMLYVELKSVLGGLRRTRMERARERARARGIKAKKAREEAAAAAKAEAKAKAEAEAEAEATVHGLAQHDEDETTKTTHASEEKEEVVAAGDSSDKPRAVITRDVADSKDGAGGADDAEDMINKKGDAKNDEEEKKMFERLGDMQDDLSCLTLSRELQVLVSEFTMLLLCVSSTESCRSLLSQPRWIAVLLALLRLGPPYAQRRALRLLRRLLPHCDPESLIEIDNTQQQSDGVDWSIITIVKEPGPGADTGAAGSERDDSVDEDSDEGNGEGASDEKQSMKGTSVGEVGRSSGRISCRTSGVPIIRVTSLSSSVHADLIPARSLLCFFLDAVGAAYQTSSHPEWLGYVSRGDGGSSAGSAEDKGGSTGTLRDARSWTRGQAPPSSSPSGREKGRNAWSFSQLEGPLVCESVSLLRTLLQTPAWRTVTATLLQDALQRGNACLRLLAREAADRAEASAAAVTSTTSSGSGAVAESAPFASSCSAGDGWTDGAPSVTRGDTPDPEGTPEGVGHGVAGSAVATGAPTTVAPSALSSPCVTDGVTSTSSGSTTSATSTSATSTLLRTLGALSVLGGHVDILYPGCSAEIMPLDYGIPPRASGIRGGRSQGVSAWGVRMGRSVFGMSGLERPSGSGSGEGRGRGMVGGGGLSSLSSASGGRPCMVVSLSLAEGQAEVLTYNEVSSAGAGAAGVAGGDVRKARIVPIDVLQAVPSVPVKPGALPSGLAHRVLETLTLWCLDRSLNAAFSEIRHPTNPSQLSEPSSAPGSASQQQGPHEDVNKASGMSQGLSDVLSPAVLELNLLVGVVRLQAAKAGQTLLLHPPTASDFVKSASTFSPGRKAKGGAGAVLLEMASGVSSSSGMGDIGAMEELVAMLLAQWQFLVLDGRSKKIEEARNRARQRANAAKHVVLAAAGAESRRAEKSDAADAGSGQEGRPEDSARASSGATGGGASQNRGPGGGAKAAGEVAEEEQQEAEAEINPLTAHMAEMGFPVHWCERALAETGDDIEAALNWILSNGDVLSVEDSLRESIQAQSEVVAEVAAAEMARAEAAAVAAAAEAEEAAAAGDGDARAGRTDGEGAEDEETGERSDRQHGDASGDTGGEPGDAEGSNQGWVAEDTQEQQESLLIFNGVERPAGSGDTGTSSSDQGMETGWPRIFHCDLGEEAELPLLAEPRLGAEQVGSLYAGEEVTAVGQQGDWLHVRLYEFDEDDEEKDDDRDEDDDEDGDEEDECSQDEDEDECSQDDCSQDRMEDGEGGQRHRRYQRGSGRGGRGRGSGRGRRQLERDTYSCARCNADQLPEPLVWALRRTAVREFLRPGSCLDSPRIGWDGLEMERLPPPVDQHGPRPSGQHGAGGDNAPGRIHAPSSHGEGATEDASTSATADRTGGTSTSSMTTMFRMVRRERGTSSTSGRSSTSGGYCGGNGGEAGIMGAGTGSVYRIIAPEGIRVRRGADPQSAEVTVLAESAEIVVAEEVHDGNGGVWMRLSAPREGWIGRRSSSLVALSRASPDHSRTSGGLGGPDGDWNETGEGAEIALARELEDCMEEEAGTDLYRRDDRLFGSRQGWSLPSGGTKSVGLSGRRADRGADSRVPGERRSAVIGHASVSACWAAVANMCMAATKEKLLATAATLSVLHCRKILLTVLLQCHKDVMRTSRGGQAAADSVLSQRVAALLGAPESSTATSTSRTISSTVTPRTAAELPTPIRTSPATLRTRVAARQFSSFLQLVLFRAWRPSWWPLSGESDSFDEYLGEAEEDEEDDERSCMDDKEPMSARFRSLPVMLTPLVSCLIRAASAQRFGSSGCSGADHMSGTGTGTGSRGLLSSRGLSFGAQVEEAVLQSVASQLRQATRIGHRDQAWASSDMMEMSDAHCLRYPRLRYVTWAARVVQAGSGAPTVPRRVFHAWAAGLKSPSLPVKQQVCSELSRLLDDAVQAVDRVRRTLLSGTAATSDEATDGAAEAEKEAMIAQKAMATRRLRQCVELLPLERLRSLAERRMLKEGEDEPMLSRALQAIVDLVASADLAWRVLQEEEDGLKAEKQERNVSTVVAEASSEVAVEAPAHDSREGIYEKEDGRPVLCLPAPSAYVTLQGRDLEPPWTAEFWVLRPNADGTWEDGDGRENRAADDDVDEGEDDDNVDTMPSAKLPETKGLVRSPVPPRRLKRSFSERVPPASHVAQPSIARAASTPSSSVDLSQLPPTDPDEGAPTLVRARSVDAVGKHDVGVDRGAADPGVGVLTNVKPDDGYVGLTAHDFPLLPSTGGFAADHLKSAAAAATKDGGDASSRRSDGASAGNRQLTGAFMTADTESAAGGQKSRPAPWWDSRVSGTSTGRSGPRSGIDGGDTSVPGGAAAEERRGGEQSTGKHQGGDSEGPPRKGEMGTEPAEYLMSSQSGHIKVQAGGTVFSQTVGQSSLSATEEDGAGDTRRMSENQRPVYSEACCVSMGSTGEKERAFDAVVPTGRWVHLAIVASPSSMGRTTLYIDGEAVDTISLRMSLPMGCLGAGPHAQEAAAASSAGGGSFVGLLAQVR